MRPEAAKVATMTISRMRSEEIYSAHVAIILAGTYWMILIIAVDYAWGTLGFAPLWALLVSLLPAALAWALFWLLVARPLAWLLGGISVVLLAAVRTLRVLSRNL